MAEATVTIGTSTWQCSLAQTPGELSQGLSGIASIPAETGMLFDLGFDYEEISINMNDMLFNLDIIYINSQQGVVGTSLNVAPGDEEAFDAAGGLGARYFMEVNAGEGIGVEVGDAVSIDTPSGLLSNMGLIISSIIMVGMMGLAVRTMGKKEPVF